MTDNPATEGLALTQTLELTAKREPGVSLSRKQWDRCIEKINAAKEGWNQLWLAAAAAFFGVGAATLVGLVTLPDTGSTRLSDDARGNLVVVTVAAALLTAVCLIGYFGSRGQRDNAIDEVVKDMRLHEPD